MECLPRLLAAGLLVAMTVAGVTGCVVVPAPPPPVVAQHQVPPPVWVPGHWVWTGYGWAWRRGH
jgi:hypothetical protein